MSGEEDESVNVLVLGSSNTRISQFIKLFCAYLRYGGLKEAMFYQPNLMSVAHNVKETTSHKVRLGRHDFYFIDTPALQKSTKNCKDITNILMYFRASCRLDAIILLIEPDNKGNENCFEQYATHFFPTMKQYANNILFVVSYNICNIYDETYKKLEKAMTIINLPPIVTYNYNVFLLHEDSFYDLSESNWSKAVNFCQDLFDYITRTGIKSFYVQCMLPAEESLLKLTYNLMEMLSETLFLAESYKLNNTFFRISEYQKNVIVCYGKNCATVGENGLVPKVCHERCNCTQSIFDIAHCIIFKTPNQRCLICNCDSTLHHRNIYHKKHVTDDLDMIPDERSIALSIFVQLFLFTHCPTDTKINKFISSGLRFYSAYSKVILQNLTKDLEAELAMYTKPKVTVEKILMCISKLYEIKQLTTILPEIINDHFPNLYLNVIPQPKGHYVYKNKEVNCLKYYIQTLRTENESFKVENEVIKKESKHINEEYRKVQAEFKGIKAENLHIKRVVDELKQQLNPIFDITKDDGPQNWDKLNVSQNRGSLKNEKVD